jgi:large subunit ribosomal protein L9
MKVLLAADIKSLGLVGDVVDVADGYARNYLLPQRKALVPSQGNVKRVEELRRVAVQRREAKMAQTREHAKRLEGAEVTIQVRANEEGTLYGSVTAGQIAFALAAEGYKVDERAIIIENPIRSIDKYQLKVHLAEEIESNITVWVVPDKDAQPVDDLESEPGDSEDNEAVKEDEQSTSSSIE